VAIVLLKTSIKYLASNSKTQITDLIICCFIQSTHDLP